MRARDREYFRKKLQEKKTDLITAVQKTENYGREADSEGDAMDIVDRASSSYAKELMFIKSDSDRQLLHAVIKALERIEDGSYGECADCGEQVNRKRLEAVPWTALCIRCQEEAEQET